MRSFSLESASIVTDHFFFHHVCGIGSLLQNRIAMNLSTLRYRTQQQVGRSTGRSERMQEIAEKGYAAYRPKQGERKGIDAWLNRLQEVLESKDSNRGFCRKPNSIFTRRNLCLYPKGDLKSLPQGASA